MSEMTTDQNKDSLIKKLFDTGAHFGFSRRRRHPSVSSFLFGYKNNLDCFIRPMMSEVKVIAGILAFSKRICEFFRSFLEILNLTSNLLPFAAKYAFEVALSFSRTKRA